MSPEERKSIMDQRNRDRFERMERSTNRRWALDASIKLAQTKDYSEPDRMILSRAEFFEAWLNREDT